MNTMMKQTLAKILGRLPWRKNWLGRKSSLLFAFLRISFLPKKSSELNINFSTFAPCFIIFCKSALTPSSFFNENYHKLNISMRLENFKARKHYYTLFYTFFSQIKIIVCISHRLTFVKWITPIARRSMHIFLLISTPGAY